MLHILHWTAYAERFFQRKHVNTKINCNQAWAIVVYVIVAITHVEVIVMVIIIMIVGPNSLNWNTV